MWQMIELQIWKDNICQVRPINMHGLMPDDFKNVYAVTGETAYHLFSCATRSKYIVFYLNYMIKVDQRMPLTHVSFPTCGFITGLGAPWKEAAVSLRVRLWFLALVLVVLGYVL
ncbi:putative alcohol dehydrogenase [Helianthus annuus]|nr:putative alcohol dehydrogenase [Helianthus annuus]